MQWQAWRLLYAAVRLHPGLRVPAAVVSRLISSLIQPIPEAVDIIACDINAHIAHQNHAIRAYEACKEAAFQHNLCAKLEGQLLSILLTLCIAGNRDTKLHIRRAHCIELLYIMAKATMLPRHLTVREPWLLHPEVRTRLEQLSRYVASGFRRQTTNAAAMSQTYTIVYWLVFATTICMSHCTNVSVHTTALTVSAEKKKFHGCCCHHLQLAPSNRSFLMFIKTSVQQSALTHVCRLALHVPHKLTASLVPWLQSRCHGATGCH